MTTISDHSAVSGAVMLDHRVWLPFDFAWKHVDLSQFDVNLLGNSFGLCFRLAKNRADLGNKIDLTKSLLKAP